MQRALLAVREDQKSDWLKKKSAEVAEADIEDEDGEDTDIGDEGEYEETGVCVTETPAGEVVCSHAISIALHVPPPPSHFSY